MVEASGALSAQEP